MSKPMATNVPSNRQRSMAEIHEEVKATLREIKQEERRLARQAEREGPFGFVRQVMTGEPGTSVLDE